MEETTPKPTHSPEPTEPTTSPDSQIKSAGATGPKRILTEAKREQYNLARRMNAWGRGPAKYVDAAGTPILRNNRHQLTCPCRFCTEKMTKKEAFGGAEGQARTWEAQRGKPRPMDPKDARFIKFFCDPKSPTYLKKRASMTKAGFSITRKSASLGIRAKRAILLAFEKAGIDAPLLAERVRSGLDATKTEIISYKGEVTAQVDKTDFTERRQMVELAMRVRQDVPHDDPAAGAQVHLHIPSRLTTAAWDAEVTATPVPPYPERRTLPEAPLAPDDGIYEDADDILTDEEDSQ